MKNINADTTVITGDLIRYNLYDTAAIAGGIMKQNINSFVPAGRHTFQHSGSITANANIRYKTVDNIMSFVFMAYLVAVFKIRILLSICQ